MVWAVRIRLLLAGLMVAATALPAQRPVPQRRGFEPSVTLMLDRRYFGGRLESHGTGTATYDAPFGFGVLGQWPLSRRSGVEVELVYHPDTRQRIREDFEERLSGSSIKHIAVRAALDWRLKPFVPVYFFGGGGVAQATRPAGQGLRGTMTEPELSFGFGVDPRSHERIGFRFRYAGFIVFPAAPDAPGVTARGPTYDWTWQAGLRVPFNRHPARSTP
jgi:hypothetical protein